MRASALADWLAARSLGMDAAAELRAASDGGALYDASARDRMLFAGPDRVDFIQGLCTNDVEALAEAHALEAAFITPKGKLLADARVVKLEDGLLFDLESGRAAALEEHVSKYRVHEDVQWLDVSEALAALELWGPEAGELLGTGPLAQGEGRAVTLADASFAAVGTPFGAVLYLPAEAATGVAEALVFRGATVIGEGTREVRRLALGLGRFGLDWDEATNPLEAGLDRALNYKKGCYVGQEVVAKATYIGHVNRRLVRLEWEGEAVPAGTPLVAGRSPGRVTSAAKDVLSGRTVALGVVRR